MLLDICKVDYENVVIAYSVKVTKPASSLPLTTTHRRAIITDRANFYTWLTETQGMASTTSHSYVSAINNCESFAKENHIGIGKIYGIKDHSVVKETVNALLSDEAFLAYNNQQHNRPRAAMKKYLDYLISDITLITPDKDKPEVNLTPYKSFFQKAIRKAFV